MLLDEMDPLVEKATRYDVDAYSFFNSLRTEVNKGRLKLVIAGFRQVSEMMGNADHPFYNLCEKIRLRVLAKKRCKRTGFSSTFQDWDKS